MRIRSWMIAAAVCWMAVSLAPPSALALSSDNGLGGAGSPPPSPEPLVPVGGPWQEFAFSTVGVDAVACGDCVPSSGGNSVFAPAPPWTVTCPAAGCILTVQDAFANGDVFDVFDNAVKIGSTSVVPASGNCGSDPAVCAQDPASSQGVFVLAGGQSHSITIRPTASPFGSGAAYFRATERLFADTL